MKNTSDIRVFAFTGGNGSGKTTYALKLAKEKGFAFFSLDKTIKNFNVPINSYEDYMTFYQKALDLMSKQACEVLKAGESVVFDFGGGLPSRIWLKEIAHQVETEIEIFHLEVPIDERLQRIKKRNFEKDSEIYSFHMSDEEFFRHNKAESQPPPEEPGVHVTVIRN